MLLSFSLEVKRLKNLIRYIDKQRRCQENNIYCCDLSGAYEIIFDKKEEGGIIF